MRRIVTAALILKRGPLFFKEKPAPLLYTGVSSCAEPDHRTIESYSREKCGSWSPAFRGRTICIEAKALSYDAVR